MVFVSELPDADLFAAVVGAYVGIAESVIPLEITVKAVALMSFQAASSCWAYGI
jgi:hypothetical protein